LKSKEKEATNAEIYDDKEGHKTEKKQKTMELNPVFIQTLLKESKFKVKHLMFLYIFFMI